MTGNPSGVTPLLGVRMVFSLVQHFQSQSDLQHFQNEIIQFHFESFLEKTRFFQKSTPRFAARCPCGQRERLDFFKVKAL
jgi:hypothetical protein